MTPAGSELEVDLSPREQEKLLYLDLVEEVDRLRAYAVRVGWEDDSGWQPDEFAYLTQFLDDGVWHLTLPRGASRAEQLEAIQRTWVVLMTRSDLDNHLWYVCAADPEDPDSLPLRRTHLLRTVPRG